MNDSNFDYDYPSSGKLATSINLNNPFVKSSNVITNSASCSNLQSIQKTPYSLSSGVVPHGNCQPFTSFNIRKTSLDNSNVNLFLSASKLDYDEISQPRSWYYSIPKNIPVNPRFASQHTSPNSSPQLPIKSNGNECTRIPDLPKKSSHVISKISNYSSSPSIANYSIPFANQTTDLVPKLNKQNTSKPLPSLPGTFEAKEVNLNYSIPASQNTVAKTNLYDVVKTCQYRDVYLENDFEDDCDYEYDYVCLESSKKLEGDDSKIKSLISKNLQSKYESLILNANDAFNLRQIENSLTSVDVVNKKYVFQRYRRFLHEALHNFDNWTDLTIEIITHNHPPEVYFNFVKHILLSGQNYLLIVKSLFRHLKTLNHQCKMMDELSGRFVDNLEKIVSSTKRASSEFSNVKLTAQMVDSIKCASQVALELNKFCFNLE